MAFVHSSVNSASISFLNNEKRYNYTTPKSFLEQIALYQNLLTKKDEELIASIVRLENGLEKLRSTAQQVRTSAMLKIQIIIYSQIWLSPKH